MTRLGYQIPNFTYPDGQGGRVGSAGLFEVVRQQAVEADRSGFDTVMVMDHFYQLPFLGDPEEPMLECYALLSALAQHTEHVRLSALVTGNTYRNPALLAKVLATLDVVSGGRAQLGIGAGWYELEHESLGFEFGTFTERFEKLEEALQIIGPMLRGERPSLDGRHYRVRDAVSEPSPVRPIPIMIGGSGERKTLRMVAQYADESNLICAPEDVPRKLEVLAEHCERLGRDRRELVVSWQRSACVAPTHEQARDEVDALLARRGVDTSSMGDDDAARARSAITYGSPDELGEVFSGWLALGVDGFTVNAVANGHVPGRVSLLGETLSEVVAP
ncbi:MAG: LLM class F420-dependent oxidoreductase [Acidimicrobiia bacterium]